MHARSLSEQPHDEADLKLERRFPTFDEFRTLPGKGMPYNNFSLHFVDAGPTYSSAIYRKSAAYMTFKERHPDLEKSITALVTEAWKSTGSRYIPCESQNWRERVEPELYRAYCLMAQICDNELELTS